MFHLDSEEERCECGVLLTEHPPLPKPEPLASWMAVRSRDPRLMQQGELGKSASPWAKTNTIIRKVPD